MDDIALRVERLSKLYRIGPQERYRTLRETLTDIMSAPFRRIRSGPHRPNADNTIWALKDVSFEVHRGQIVGIIGRNGAGKSTLLKILSRITPPTEGRAEIRGRISSLLEVGTGFHSELTGRENIYLNGAILGMKKEEIERKFDEIVAFAEVARFIDTPVKHYSSGMYMRLAFAVAAHLEPEILLVDEVLAVGDAAFQKKCLGKMGNVAKEGRTVLFVSHNMVSLQNLCTRGVLLHSGQIAMDGNIFDVIGKYLDVGFSKEQTGEVSWASPETAPGDNRARLKAVRVVSGDKLAEGVVDIDKNFRIEVDYWNLQPNRRYFISIHLHNSMGMTVLTSGNLPSASLSPDPWYSHPYPRGLFRTSCTIPGNFLNDGTHSISVAIVENHLPSHIESDNVLWIKDILPFFIRDTGAMREEFVGTWIGVVRPRLDWKTEHLDALDDSRKETSG